MTDADAPPAGRIFAEVELQVQFYDLDPMQVVWHGNYARFLEVARCALLDTIDYNYAQMRESGYAWPVIDMHIRYLQPATFGERIKVRAELVEWENRLKLQYLVTSVATGLRLTKATTVQVAVEVSANQMCLASPPVLFEKLGLPLP